MFFSYGIDIFIHTDQYEIHSDDDVHNGEISTGIHKRYIHPGRRTAVVGTGSGIGIPLDLHN